MALTLEDLDRRVTVLEQAAETERNIVRAVSEIVSESEKRVRVEMSELRGQMSGLRGEISESEKGMRAEMSALRADLTDRISAAERRFTDLLNERFDAVMVAIDRSQNPPK